MSFGFVYQMLQKLLYCNWIVVEFVVSLNIFCD